MTEPATTESSLITLNEIQTEIDKLPVMMSEKGCINPSVSYSIRSDSAPCLMLKTRSTEGSQIGYSSMKFIYGETLADMIEKAIDIISAIPDPIEAATERFVKKMADTVDEARNSGVPDEYTNPVSAHIKVVYENLLPAPSSNEVTS